MDGLHNGCDGKFNFNFLLGVQLEAIEKQRRRAIDAKDLFTYYLDFARDNTSDRLDSLQLSSDKSGKSQCAVMTRRLLNLSKDLDAEGKITESIEKYGERLEKDLLKAFDKAYRRGNFRDMRVCSFAHFNMLTFFTRNMPKFYTTSMEEPQLYRCLSISTTFLSFVKS